MYDNPIIVITTHGKRDSVDRFSIKLFYDYWKAFKYKNDTNSNSDDKYWTHSEIISPNTTYLLGQASIEETDN